MRERREGWIWSSPSRSMHDRVIEDGERSEESRKWMTVSGGMVAPSNP